jgi:tetratricopeptide (TPR) repeat protein
MEVKTTGDYSPGIVFGNYEVRIEAPPPITLLHQLQPPPTCFVGRSPQLEELLSRVNRAGRSLLGIWGMGGIGKTALASLVANRLKEEYQDAQIYMDLKGNDAMPLDATEAMRWVINSFDVAERVSNDRQTLEARYRSVLHGKRVILVMDNAADTDQIAALVPPEGCLLLITSRVRFVLDGLQWVSLGELTREESVQLMRAICPRIDDMADRIASFCADLPLAITIAASTLADSVTLTTEQYASRLADEASRLCHLKTDQRKERSIEASLLLSYKLLPTAIQPLFYALSVFRGTFSASAAQAVWDVDEARAGEALSRLVKVSLLQYDEQLRRFKFHDLVRIFATSQMTDEEHKRYASRHLLYFMRSAQASQKLYEAGNESIVAALAHFEQEWPNIQVGYTRLSSLASVDLSAARLLLEYVFSAVDCMKLRVVPSQRIAWLENALSAARLLQDLSSELAALSNLGTAYTDLGLVDRAAKLWEETIPIVTEHYGPRTQAIFRANLAAAYGELGMCDKAVIELEESLKVLRGTGDAAEGNALVSLGATYVSMGDLVRGTTALEEALQFATRFGILGMKGSVHINIGTLKLDQEDFRSALESYNAALCIGEQIGDPHLIALARRGLGNVLLKKGDSRSAHAMYQDEVKCLKMAGHPDADERAAFLETLRRQLER